MTGVTFFETLRRHWRGMLYWGIGVGLMGILQVIVVPDADTLQQYAEIYESMPGLIEALGGGDAAYNATPEGYLALQYFSFIVVIFAVYAVIGGLNVTANDEDAGITNMLLSLPLPRWRLLAEKTLAYALMLSGAIMIAGLGLCLGVVITPAVKVDLWKLIVSSFNIIPSTLLVLVFTVFAGAITRRKSFATGLAAVFVVASYFIDTLGRAASTSFANTVRTLSFFKYYDGTAVMQYGLAWGNILLLVAVSLALVGAAVWRFQRRDIN